MLKATLTRTVAVDRGLLGFSAALVAFAAFFCMAGTANAQPYEGYQEHGVTRDSGYVKLDACYGAKVKKQRSWVWSNDTYLEAHGKDMPNRKAVKKTKLKGISYNKKKNVLTLTNARLSGYRLYAGGMGKDFTIKVVGKKNELAGIICGDVRSKYPTGLHITGSGKLAVGKGKYSRTPINVKSKKHSVRVVVDKKTKLDVYAAGTGNAMYVSGYTNNKNIKRLSSKKVISVKGKVKTKLVRKIRKAPGSVFYEQTPIIDVGDSFNTELYLVDGKPYYWYSVDEEEPGGKKICSMLPVKRVYKDVYSDATGSEIEIPESQLAQLSCFTARLTAGVSSCRENGIKLNGGKYYGRESEDSLNYYDTRNQCWYGNKWDIYRPVGNGISDNGKKVVYAKKVKTVKNKKDLPRGYKGTVTGEEKARYVCVLANKTVLK